MSQESVKDDKTLKGRSIDNSGPLPLKTMKLPVPLTDCKTRGFTSC